MPIDLRKYIAEAEEQLRPALETRIGRLAKEQREEQLYTGEKLQQAGKFTSGFRQNWMERVMDIFAGRKEEARGEMGTKALSVAQQLYGLAHEAELQEKRIDAEARMKKLDRELTKQGWGFQAKQSEMDRQLTKEGWDWQSKENILNRTLTREELAQQATLTREGYSLQETLARLAREGVAGRGVSAPTYAPGRDTSLDAYKAAKDAYEDKATAYGVGGYPPSAAIFNIPSPEIKRQTSPYAYRYTPTLPSKRPTQTTQQKRRGGVIY